MKIIRKIIVWLFFLGFILPVNHSCKKADDQPEDVFSPLTSDEPLPYEYTDWMHDIDDCVPITSITIPGTHDSGADLHTSQVTKSAVGMVICQHFTLADQLKVGVRWFDVRLRLYNGGLCVHHDMYYLHKNFDDLLHQALDFLDKHHRETVIFMIKQEYSKESDHDFAEAVYKRLEANSPDLSRFWLFPEFPLMIGARGKIVIVRRFDNDLGHHLGIHMDWTDNTKGSFYTDLNDYYVQDHYKLNFVSYETKCDEIKSVIDKAHADEYPGSLYLNFTSGEDWTHTLISHAKQINPVIDSYIQSHSNWTHCGVIMVNFAGGSDTENKKSTRYCTPDFVKHIIELNDFSPKVVTIGTQVWMKKNLNVSYYRNGDIIPHIENLDAWSNAKYGAWCEYDNICCFEDHGKLYNSYALTDSAGLCPEGFHVPTTDEWTTLLNYLGGIDVAGGKLKGTEYVSGWCDPNTGATNESGFTAPANGIFYMGLFDDRCHQAVYWSKPVKGSNEATFFRLHYDNTKVDSWSDDPWTYGASVRCIKN